jgi:hypothetical protein
MKMIDEIRRDNMATLVKEMGSVKAIAEALGSSESQISQWLLGSAHSKTGKPRGMRAGSARKIETACRKPAGWLDLDHSDQDTVTVEALTVPMFGLVCPRCGQVRHHSFIELELNDQITCDCGHSITVADYYGIPVLQQILECLGSRRLTLRKR